MTKDLTYLGPFTDHCGRLICNSFMTADDAGNKMKPETTEVKEYEFFYLCKEALRFGILLY